MIEPHHAAELSQFRATFAAMVREHAPDWSGESYSTWRQYPVLPVDAPAQIVRALALVKLLDAAVSEPALAEEFRHWRQTLDAASDAEAADARDRPLIQLGLKALGATKMMLDAKLEKMPRRKQERRQKAEEALQKANGDQKQAAVLIKKSVKTLNRWLGGK